MKLHIIQITPTFAETLTNKQDINIMANTYTQIYIHAVFAVKYRLGIIPMDKRDDIYAYMGGIINRHDKCQSIKIGGVSDHVHLLFRMPPTLDIADLMQSIKIGGTNYINQHRLTLGKFAWQEGYGAFSVSPTHTDGVEEYIENQIEHHRGVTFLEEYRRLLERNKVEYDERYIFTDLI